jgi:hypothetical protein
LSGEDGDDAPRAWSTRTQHTRRTRGACTTRGRMWRSAAESSPSVPVRARPLSLTRLLRPTALARETLRVARVATLYSSGEGEGWSTVSLSDSQTVRASGQSQHSGERTTAAMVLLCEQVCSHRTRCRRPHSRRCVSTTSSLLIGVPDKPSSGGLNHSVAPQPLADIDLCSARGGVRRVWAGGRLQPQPKFPGGGPLPAHHACTPLGYM